MRNTILYFLIMAIVPALVLISCEEELPIPKPKGYLRLDFPAKAYENYQSQCNFSFEKPENAIMRKARGFSEDNCALNLEFPLHRATLHLTYLPLDSSQLNVYLDQCRQMAFEHRVKANSIDEIPRHYKANQVHGLLYSINGNVASNLQFYVTDSSDHFLRGALYFNTAPNSDSLAPSLEYLRSDIEHMLETLQWSTDSTPN